MLEKNDSSIKPDTKRSILHSASVCAGIKIDKSRLEAGLSTVIHDVFISSPAEEQQLKELGRRLLEEMRDKVIDVTPHADHEQSRQDIAEDGNGLDSHDNAINSND